MVCVERSIRPGRARHRKPQRKDEKTRTRNGCRGLYVTYDQRILTQEVRKDHQTKKTLSWICIHQIQDERQDTVRHQKYSGSEIDCRSWDTPYPIDRRWIYQNHRTDQKITRKIRTQNTVQRRWCRPTQNRRLQMNERQRKKYRSRQMNSNSKYRNVRKIDTSSDWFG